MADQKAQAVHPAATGLVLFIALFCAIGVCAIWLAVELLGTEDREARVLEVMQENANLARAFEEHSIRTLAYVDEVALLVRDRFEKEGTSFDLRRFFESIQVPRALIHNAVVTDQQGVVIVGSNGGVGTFLGDREHIRAHMQQDTRQLFIGKPVLARINKSWSIVVTRRVNHRDGTLRGVVAIAIDPGYFSNFYKDVDLGRDGVVGLIGRDGIIRARLSTRDEGIGTDLNDSVMFRRLQTAAHGAFTATSRTDGVSRIFAYRTVRDYPLIVSVGVAESEALAPILARQHTYRMAALAASATLIGMSAFLIFLALRRAQAEAAALGYLNELRGKAALLAFARDEAEAGSRAKSQFLATISHEIRTPMNGIMGMLELLRRTPLTEAQSEFARLAYTSAEALLRVLSDVLDFSRMEAGRLALESLPFDVHQIASDVTQLFAEAARKKGIGLHLDIAADVPRSLIGDSGRLRQVVSNLVDNAIKFTVEGEVTVRVVRAPHALPDASVCRLRFEVRDTGIGIDEAHHARLFQAFSQADASTTRRFGGSGLGLAICRHLVELMHGTIGVDSQPGAGSVFWFEVMLDTAASTPRLTGNGA